MTCRFLIALLIGLCSTTVYADKAMLLMGVNCQYQLFSGASGTMTLTKIDPSKHSLQKRDMLEGDFSSKKSSQATNLRTGETISIRIEGANLPVSDALNQYSMHCG